MRKYVLGVAGLVALVGAVLVVMLTKKPEARPASREVVPRTSKYAERGKYLVKHVLACLGCHSKRDWNRYGGPIVGHIGAGGRCLNERWGMPGRVCAPNLTPDEGSGLGAWTDGEIMRAIREGVGRHGDALFPLMPYTAYRHLSDDDTRAVVVYLRSLKRRAASPERSRLDFPESFFVAGLPVPLTGPVPPVKPELNVSYGEYLTHIAGCKGCHTAHDDRLRPLAGEAFGGGREFKSAFGAVRSPNITPHATGLLGWSEAKFVQRFQAFREKDAPRPVDPGRNTPMPWLEYAGMSAEDLAAIYRYLKSVPALDRTVEVRPDSSAR